MMRRLLAVLSLTVIASVLTARADTEKRPAKKGPDNRILVGDAGVQQAALKRAFEAFQQRLSILANRLENGSDQDKEKARALKKALKLASDQGVSGKFDALIRGLTTKGAEEDNDVLSQVLKDNEELRKDLQRILALLTRDDREVLKEQK